MDASPRPLPIEKLSQELLAHFRSQELAQESQESKRIIAFVGAGASWAAGLPLGQELKKDLFEKLTNGSTAVLTPEGARQECLRYWSGRIRPPGKIGDDDDPVNDPRFSLLHFCQALSPYANVRDAIRKLIGGVLRTPATCPLLAYELLAHLLNHRFIDHIISLNFDLLLDESLKDELGEDGVDIVVSERDIPGLSSFDNVDDKPRCVKPHGSISVPDSMRFTMIDASGISSAMGSLVKKVVFGPDPTDDPPTGLGGGRARQPVILLFMGWACRDREFQRILTSQHSQVDQIYWFYPAADNEMGLRIAALRKTFDELAAKTGNKPEIYQLSFENDLGDELLDVLTRLGELSREEHFGVPPMARHLLYCYCFSPLVPDPTKALQIPLQDRNQELQDAWDRLKFEVFYFSLKTKGSFSTHNMSQVRRIQHSFAHFRELSRPRNEVPEEMRWTDDCDLVERCFSKQLVKEGTENYSYKMAVPCKVGPSLDKILRYFWEKRLRHGQMLPRYLSFVERGSDVGTGCWQNAMLQHLVDVCGSKGGEQEQILSRNLAQHLETVRGMTETEIAKLPATRHLWLFRKSREISSIGALKQYTEKFIEGREDRQWTRLWVIAETGEWLLDDKIKNAIAHHSTQLPNVSVHLIVRAEAVPLALGATPGADHGVEVKTALLKASGGKLDVTVDYLPWWRHNRHMTLLLNEDVPLAGIYFRRRLKTPLIYPVSVEDSHDLQVLVRIFKRYRKKAEEAHKNVRAAAT